MCFYRSQTHLAAELTQGIAYNAVICNLSVCYKLDKNNYKVQTAKQQKSYLVRLYSGKDGISLQRIRKDETIYLQQSTAKLITKDEDRRLCVSVLIVPNLISL